MKRLMPRQAMLLMRENARLRAAFPAFRLFHRSGNGYGWRGLLQPSPGGNEYTVEIRYNGISQPLVYVRKPALQLAPGAIELPHVYRDGGSLCLFHPPSMEWRSGDPIAETIVPWTVKWLWFYEVWLVTGVWEGGGIEHGSQPNDPQQGEPHVSHP